MQSAALQVGETYDWRLSVANMERRDKYFSRLRARIELLHSTQGEKVRPLVRMPVWPPQRVVIVGSLHSLQSLAVDAGKHAACMVSHGSVCVMSDCGATACKPSSS